MTSKEHDRLRQRMMDTADRNETEKSQPKTDRDIFDLQQDANYGYDQTDLQHGSVKAKIKKGFGGQPFMSANKDDYGGATGKLDYDSLLKKMPKGQDQQVAQDMLSLINDKDHDISHYPNGTQRAMSEMVALTQVVEAHNTRQPGADKMGRASMRAVVAGDSSLHGQFNRKDGAYLPARAKAGGADFGGQEEMRSFLGKDPKKSDKIDFQQQDYSQTYKMLQHLSDSSGDEADDSDGAMDEESDNDNN